MTNTQILNTVGLVFGLFGVLLIFIWGPPQPNFEEGIGLGLEDGTPIDSTGKTVKQYNDEVRHKKRKHNMMSRFGLGFIFVGFLFQIWGAWA